MSKRKPYDIAPAPEGAPVYWTSLEDLDAQLEKSPELKARMEAELEAEFPQGVGPGKESADVTRRTFMTLMGAAIGMATLEGCRRPVNHILPYARTPEEVNPGVANRYATIMERRGDALGLLVTSYEGRPTKVEGNFDHPSSHGGADLLAQASVLDLYDPDRSRAPTQNGHEKTWPELDRALNELLAAHRSRAGQGLRILSEPTISPSFVRLREAIRRRYPQVQFHTWDSASTSNIREGAKIAFGAPLNQVVLYERAEVIVSLDCDFLQTEPGMVAATRGYARGRYMHSARDEGMNRLYVVESTYSTTGSNADHRLRLPSRDIEGYLLALAARLVSEHHLELGELAAVVNGAAAPQGVSDRWINAVAADLFAHRQHAVVVVGSRQPSRVHALAHALNVALGSVGGANGVIHHAQPVDETDTDHTSSLRGLLEAIEAGQVETLLVLGGNPVYDAPGEANFEQRFGRVQNRIHLSMFRDETSERATWHIPRTHYLESWGDGRALDGSLSVQQPLIAPLYWGRSDIELLAAVLGEGVRASHDIVRETLDLAENIQNDARHHLFDRKWRRTLHQGVSEGSSRVVSNEPVVRRNDVAQAFTAARAQQRQPLAAGNFEVVFAACNKMLDGSRANNAWLQELPDPITKIVWDNAAYVSPRTAQALGVNSGDVLRLTKGNRSIEIAAWVLPGHADNSVTLPLGWGRRKAGRVGNGKGFNVNPLRGTDNIHFTDGVRVEKVAGRTYELTQTQDHHRMEGRPVSIEATLTQYRELPNFPEWRSPTPRTLPLWRGPDYSHGHKWGMTIDLNACTGCNACVVACQSENNIPVVGKDQVGRGREMHWIRVDRYFVSPRARHSVRGNTTEGVEGTDADPMATTDPSVAYQPLLCQQCENAPCENVCPVNATEHSPEGLNDMAYNRCVGTRYCSNNCPYKVRRFNYLNWHNDSVYQQENGSGHSDPDVPESVRMQHNPNVTVRFRGVMEKCTYCVQRIQRAKIHAKNDPYRNDGPRAHLVRDGEVLTACQQTCPAAAITFGDLNDSTSHVAQAARTDRLYRLLGEVGTRPRTMYLGKIRNPNSEMQG